MRSELNYFRFPVIRRNKGREQKVTETMKHSGTSYDQ